MPTRQDLIDEENRKKENEAGKKTLESGDKAQTTEAPAKPDAPTTDNADVQPPEKAEVADDGGTQPSEPPAGDGAGAPA